MLLSHEARHVSVMVAGPSKYNAKKLDHSDKILSLSKEICDWVNGLETQIEMSNRRQDKVEKLVDMIRFCDSVYNVQSPVGYLAELAPLDKDKFIELFEKLQPKYKWRKNSNVYKLYMSAKDGTLKVITKDVFFENADFTAYRMGDRAYIKFTMRPIRQLIVALKSRGWWWNARESAWSTYLDRVDEEWVMGISEQYGKYI